MTLTAVFEQVPEGYIAFIEEWPGANTQGSTLEEARETCGKPPHSSGLSYFRRRSIVLLLADPSLSRGCW